MDNPYATEPEEFDLDKEGHLEMYRNYVKVLEEMKVLFSVDITGEIHIVTAHIELAPGSYSNEDLIKLIQANVPSKHV